MDAQYEARLHSPKKNSPVKLQTNTNNTTRRSLFSKELYYDRLIPSLTASSLQTSFSLMSPITTTKNEHENETKHYPPNDPNTTTLTLYKQILQNELLGTLNNIKEDGTKMPKNVPRSPTCMGSPTGSDMTGVSPTRLFSYKSKKQTVPTDSPYSLSPISSTSQQLLSSPIKPQRKIPKVPYKVLEAPQIQDDFYLNLVDWSSQNLLAVGLNQSVYLWNASTSQVSRLCDVTPAEMITSLSWISNGTHLAVGSSEGSVTLWDVTKQKKIRTFLGHKARVGTLAWSHSPQWTLSTGSRDRTILQRDVRTDKHFVTRLTSHKQEVCGLKWGYNPPHLLASGGNDNKLLVWDERFHKEELQNSNMSQPLYTFMSHKAAIKAITWSPHQRGLLTSGGGTADQTIRFWNTITGVEFPYKISSGSQVCNLQWSKNVNEFVSTHGYSQNQITVWAYPSLVPVVTLTGHSMRVLYLATSPDGQTIVTGAGDETLRFWSIFPKAKVSADGRDFASSLYSFSDIR